jgi:hypothetical protein
MTSFGSSNLAWWLETYNFFIHPARRERQCALRGPTHRPLHLWTLALHARDAGRFPSRQAGGGRRWGAVDLAVEEHFPGAVQIVDLWHAQEHVCVRWRKQSMDELLLKIHPNHHISMSSP